MLNNDILIHIINQTTDVKTLTRMLRVNKLFSDKARIRINKLYRLRVLFTKHFIGLSWYYHRDFWNNQHTVAIDYQRCKYKSEIPCYRIINYICGDDQIIYDSDLLVTSRKDRLELFKFTGLEPFLPTLSQSEAYLINYNRVKSVKENGIHSIYDKGNRLISRRCGDVCNIFDPFSDRILYSCLMTSITDNGIIKNQITIRRVTFVLCRDELESFYTLNRSNQKGHDCVGHTNLCFDTFRSIFQCSCDECGKTAGADKGGKGVEGINLLFLITRHKMFLPLLDNVCKDQRSLLGCYMWRKTHCYYCDKKLGKSHVKSEGERWHVRCFNEVGKIPRK